MAETSAVSIGSILVQMPYWYRNLMIIFSAYFSIRGVIYEYERLKIDPLARWKKIFVYYIQEIIFKIVFTVSGFMALFIASHIWSTLKTLNDIGTGTAVVLIFLFIWGVTGLSGYLTHLILVGKIPGMKSGN